MIFTDRKSVRNPFEAPSLADKAIQELKRAHQQISEGSTQRRFQFTAYRHQSVRAALYALFHDKCAYCETSLAGAFGDIEQFRPKAIVSEAIDHPGYWWLANSWENLLIACHYCNRKSREESGEIEHTTPIGKHNRFPLIDEEKRAFTPESDLLKEQPLLLDPTVDDPSLHLVFSDDGLVFSNTERGNTTISILGLNRRNLITQRKITADRYSSILKSAAMTFEHEKLGSKDLLLELFEMAKSKSSYAGMIQQFLRRDLPILEKQKKGFTLAEQSEVDNAKHSLQSLGPAAAISIAAIKIAAHSTKTFQKQMANYSLADKEGIKRYKAQRRSIESISIRNIRALSAFDVNLSSMGTGAGRWLMMLGENGAGKSTVLQAIALVLGGSESAARLIKEKRIIFSELVRLRCKSGEISVKMSGFDTPHRLKIYKDRLEFIYPTSELVSVTAEGETRGIECTPPTLIAGYGATRLLPRQTNTQQRMYSFARVENLFDPFVPLMDANKWLAELPKKDFDRVAIVLKDLLAVDPHAYFDRKHGNIILKTNGDNFSLSSLSVGYQTMVAATVDMLEVLSRVWSNPLDAEGIVMIDELDSHLHPTWQMQIVNSLRTALPGIQFITTTHQPLCLRGLHKGEIVVMRRGASSNIDILTDLPSPADFRVDQLLTSPFFGLNSTTDPDTERLFDSYYALLAMEKHSEQDKAELEELTTKLRDRRHFGDTQRESLYFEAIDRVLAQQVNMPKIPPNKIRETAISEISAIWSELTDDLKTFGKSSI